MKRILISLIIFSLFIPSALALEDTFWGYDDRGYPVKIEVKTMPTWEMNLRKFLSVTFAVVSPQTLQRGQQGTVSFYFTISCPDGCEPRILRWELWDYQNVRTVGSSVDVVGVDCYMSMIVDTTFVVPLDMKEGQATIKGWLEGYGLCKASNVDEGQFSVGSPPPDCTGQPCTNWSGCMDSIQTRTCYYNDCRTYLETRTCDVPTTTIPITTTRPTVERCSDYGYTDSCGEGDRCEKITISDLECCTCVPISVTTIPTTTTVTITTLPGETTTTPIITTTIPEEPKFEFPIWLLLVVVVVIIIIVVIVVAMGKR